MSWGLIFEKTDLLSLLMMARTSNKMYKSVEHHFKKNKSRYKIPQYIGKYNSNIHWICEEWISSRCFKCGNKNNCISYYMNWDLKICTNCLPMKVSHRFFRYFGRKPIVFEDDVKGFTKCELRRKLIFHFGIDDRMIMPVRVYHKSDIIQITKNRYGFEEYSEYTKFIKNRYKYINNKINSENIQSININHHLTDYLQFPKSKSGFLLRLDRKKLKVYRDKIHRAIKRYDICKEIFDNNNNIYNKVYNVIDDSKLVKVLQFIRLRYNMKFYNDMDELLLFRKVGNEIFYTDRCFIYFKSYAVNIDKVISRIQDLQSSDYFK